jgi:hypothetical protein
MEAAIASLIGAVADGEVNDREGAVAYLAGFGIERAQALDVVGGIVENREQFMEVIPMAKGSNVWSAIDLLKKSFGKKDEKKPEDEPDDDDDEDEEEDEMEDAGPVLKSLVDKLDTLSGRMDALQKSQEAILEQVGEGNTMQKAAGAGLTALLEQTAAIAASPAPRQGVVSAAEAALLHKGGGLPGGSGIRHKQFTPEMKDACTEVLAKAVKDGEISIYECSRIESQINKSLSNPAFQLDEKYIMLLKSKMNGQQ